jgi:hypothetical protein
MEVVVKVVSERMEIQRIGRESGREVHGQVTPQIRAQDHHVPGVEARKDMTLTTLVLQKMFPHEAGLPVTLDQGAVVLFDGRDAIESLDLPRVVLCLQKARDNHAK